MDAFGGNVTKSPMLDLPGQLGSLLLNASSIFGKGRLVYQVSYIISVQFIHLHVEVMDTFCHIWGGQGRRDLAPSWLVFWKEY